MLPGNLRLVKTRFNLQDQNANCFQNLESFNFIIICRQLWTLIANRQIMLSHYIVDLIRLGLLDDADHEMG